MVPIPRTGVGFLDGEVMVKASSQIRKAGKGSRSNRPVSQGSDLSRSKIEAALTEYEWSQRAITILMSVNRRSPTLSEASSMQEVFKELRRLCSALPALESFEKYKQSYWRSKRAVSTPESGTGGIRGLDEGAATTVQEQRGSGSLTEVLRRPGGQVYKSTSGNHLVVPDDVLVECQIESQDAIGYIDSALVPAIAIRPPSIYPIDAGIGPPHQLGSLREPKKKKSIKDLLRTVIGSSRKGLPSPERDAKEVQEVWANTILDTEVRGDPPTQTALVPGQDQNLPPTDTAPTVPEPASQNQVQTISNDVITDSKVSSDFQPKPNGFEDVDPFMEPLSVANHPRFNSLNEALYKSDSQISITSSLKTGPWSLSQLSLDQETRLLLARDPTACTMDSFLTSSTTSGSYIPQKNTTNEPDLENAKAKVNSSKSPLAAITEEDKVTNNVTVSARNVSGDAPGATEVSEHARGPLYSKIPSPPARPGVKTRLHENHEGRTAGYSKPSSISLRSAIPISPRTNSKTSSVTLRSAIPISRANSMGRTSSTIPKDSSTFLPRSTKDSSTTQRKYGGGPTAKKAPRSMQKPSPFQTAGSTSGRKNLRQPMFPAQKSTKSTIPVVKETTNRAIMNGNTKGFRSAELITMTTEEIEAEPTAQPESPDSKSTPLADISGIGASSNPRGRNCTGRKKSLKAATPPAAKITPRGRKENVQPFRMPVTPGTARSSRATAANDNTKISKKAGIVKWFGHRYSSGTGFSKKLALFGKSPRGSTVSASSSSPKPTSFSKEEVDEVKRRLSAEVPPNLDGGFHVVGGAYYSRKPNLDSSPTKEQMEENPIAVCMNLLYLVTIEKDPERRERMLSLTTALVDTVTKSRDAECAMEQAKISALRAESAYLDMMDSVYRVMEVVQVWKTKNLI